ncbi:MAG TPA: hypothetical protein VMI35_13640 [Puia sp.]|nr:hypothetical protein [Puia sp.]
MKRGIVILLMLVAVLAVPVGQGHAQCSICTRSAQQLGERPASALNAGIIYLALTPFLIFSYIGYRWWKSNQESE